VRHPPDRPARARLLRPPSPRERVLAAVTEALLASRRAPPPNLSTRLRASATSALEHPHPGRP